MEGGKKQRAWASAARAGVESELSATATDPDPFAHTFMPSSLIPTRQHLTTIARGGVRCEPATGERAAARRGARGRISCE